MKYKKYITEKRPLWIVPVEVIKPHSDCQGEEWLTYKDVLLIEGQKTTLKSEDDLPFRYGWKIEALSDSDN